MDLNGDGHKDMISGSFKPGDLYLFTGSSVGSFNAGQILKDKDGEILNVGLASSVFAADWDQDGDMDLLVGNYDGEVYWIANQGEIQAPVFATPVPVEVEGKPMVVDMDARPCIADWDGDGHLDLLVGDGKGKVTLFRNTAISGLPQLAAGAILVPKGTHDEPKDGRGAYGKPCITDWNEDGRLDLLLGDHSYTRGRDPEVTEAQRAKQDATRAAYKETKKKVNALSRKFGQELRQEFMEEHSIPKDQKLSKQQTQDLAQRLGTLLKNNEDSQALLKEIQVLGDIVTSYQTPIYTHGYVWVYLRQPVGAAILEADAQRSAE